MPAQSHTPTIGWPRCEVSASWWNQSGRLERRREQVDEVGRDDEERDDLRRERRPPQAADREADPDQRHGEEPERDRAEHRGARGHAAGRRAQADPEREEDGHDADGRERRDRRRRSTQRVARSGVARTISRRPSVSSDAHFETKVAAAKPAAM